VVKSQPAVFSYNKLKGITAPSSQRYDINNVGWWTRAHLFWNCKRGWRKESAWKDPLGGFNQRVGNLLYLADGF
jgi:hypothetical protein